MSTYWDLACQDCDDVFEIHANHAAEKIQDLINDLPTIAAAAKLAPQLTLHLDDAYNIYGESGREVSLATLGAWLAKHDGHRLAPKNEYGDFAGDCCKQVACAACGHSKRCRLDRGHPGLCRPSKER